MVNPSDAYDSGMQVRRDVLGDDHVDRAIAGTTEVDRDFQQLITRYAWGDVWTRPGLDRRSTARMRATSSVGENGLAI